MAKKKKEETTLLNLHKKLTPQLIGTIIMLALMTFGIVGFVYSGNNNNNQNQVQDNVDFQEFEYQGQKFWGAIKNKEQFIFMNITGFDEREDLRILSEEIKKLDEILLYRDIGFSLDAGFLIDKAFLGLKKEVIETTEKTCNSGELVLTYNENIQGDCLKFITTTNSSYRDAENLVYFLVQ